MATTKRKRMKRRKGEEDDTATLSEQVDVITQQLCIIAEIIEDGLELNAFYRKITQELSDDLHDLSREWEQEKELTTSRISALERQVTALTSRQNSE